MPPLCKTPQHVLKNVPDFLNWDSALKWIKEGQTLLQNISTFTEDNICSLEWSDLSQPPTPPFGFFPLENWRKFVFSTYFADLASYANSVDQVNFERLLFVMHTFPQGFRSWWVPISDHWWPVGYSAWYPMLETAFDVFEKTPEKLKDRMVVPALSNDHPFLYLFNYSAAPQLRGSLLTKRLIKSFVKDVNAAQPAGLSCITVSDDGIRIAKRFEMNRSGDLHFNGFVEGVYVKRLYL